MRHALVMGVMVRPAGGSMLHDKQLVHPYGRCGRQIATLLLALVAVSGCANLPDPVQGLAVPAVLPTSVAQLPARAASTVARSPAQGNAIERPTQATRTPIAAGSAQPSAALPFNI